MSAETIIKIALNETLENLVLPCPKVPENREHDYNTQSPWVRSRINPKKKVQHSLGTDGCNQHIGLFHIEVMYMKNQGVITAQSIADIILNAFKRGTKINYNGDIITCEMAEIKQAYDEEGWYVLPIIVTYRAELVD